MLYTALFFSPYIDIVWIFFFFFFFFFFIVWSCGSMGFNIEMKLSIAQSRLGGMNNVSSYPS